MRLNFRKFDVAGFFRGTLPGGGRDPLAVWRMVLAALVVLNLAGLAMVLFPPGGSVSQLDQELRVLRSQMARQQASVQTLRALLKKVETARDQQESFIKTYFMDGVSASSTIEFEILGMAKKSELKKREHAYTYEPIEGSDTLTMMTVNGNYEGTYADLLEFVNLVDRSDRFLIIDTIQASPQQTSGLLTARFKINAFLRERPSGITSQPPVPPGVSEQPAAEPVTSEMSRAVVVAEASR